VDRQTKDRLFQKGLEAFNSGHFYEAHEHWEEVWLKTPNPDKMFLQGLIQVAAAYHHYSRANNLGCHNLLHAGLRKLDCFPGEHWGLAIEPLRASVRRWLVPLRAGKNPHTMEIPQIESRSGRGSSVRK
jgi:predicted metal-dependent hydrolase